MLRWTPSGAVSAPTSVQIRVHPLAGSSVAAGAPTPGRSLRPEELRAAILHFTAGMRTPRTRPCTTLLLSGQGLLSLPELPELLALAAAEGIQEVVLHIGATVEEIDPPPFLPGRPPRIALALPVVDPAAPEVQAIARARRRGVPVSTTTLLDRAALASLDGLVPLLSRLGGPHTLTWPLPTGPGAVASAPPLRAALDRLLPVLDRLRPLVHGLDRPRSGLSVKGLPACFLGPHADLVHRTGNRWYVDAEHQSDKALLFLPDVLRYARREACRFCALAGACDGFFDCYLEQDDCPPLVAVLGATS